MGMTKLKMTVIGARATTVQFYPGQDTFEFDQGHVTKNQSITMRFLLSEIMWFIVNPQLVTSTVHVT